MSSFLSFPSQFRVKSTRFVHLAATALLVFTASLLAASTLHADELKLMSWNCTKVSSYAGYETERIIQGLDPDVALLQEWTVDTGEFTDTDDWVDQSFGTEYEYYRGDGVEGDFCMKNGIVSRWNIQTCGSWDDSYITNRYYDWAVIDIPNSAIDLQVVSVHLHSSVEATRILEVQELIGYIEANFSNSEYLVIGGDFNTSTRSSEPIPTLLDDAEWTGSCWVTTSDGTPADQNGDSDTNVLRLSDYDWLIPNVLLGDEIMSLNLGGDGDPYTGGIVFDSRVFTPLSAVSPIVYGDTANGDQDHCPVMKSYDILPGSTQLLITEVRVTNGLHDPLGLDSDWVEVCLKSGSIDMSAVYMTDHDSVYPIGNNGPLTMGYDELNGYDILIIHDAAGTSENNTTGKGANDLWDIYQSSLSLSDQDDQFIITWQNSANPDAENTYDAVCWSNDDGVMTTDARDDGNDLITKSHWGSPYVGQGTFAAGDQSPAIGDLDDGYIQRVDTMDWDDVEDWTISATHSFGIRPDAGILRFNYQPYGSSTPSDYLKDWAQGYGTDEEGRYEYGWQ